MKLKHSLLALLAMCAFGAWAEEEIIHDDYRTTLYGTLIRRVPAGTTVETTGVGNQANINQNATGSESGNYAGTAPCILIEDGATLKYTSGHAYWPMILVTNGCHATIVGVANTTPTFSRSIIVEDGATLMITNTSGCTCGHGGDTWNGSNKAFYDLKNAVFPGGKVNGFVFRRAHIIRMPLNWNGTCSKRTETTQSGRVIANDCMLVGDNPYEGWTDAPRLPSYGTYLLNPAALGESFTVPAGFELILKQVDLPKITTEYLVQHCNTSGNYMTTNGTNYTVNINLADSTSKLTFSDGNYMGNIYEDGTLVTTDTTCCGRTEKGSIYSGTLTGCGKVTLVTTAGVTGTPGTGAFAGDASGFTGTFASYNARNLGGTGPFANLIFSNDVASASVSAGAKATVTFAAGTTPATRAVGTLAGGLAAAEEGVTVSATSLAGRTQPTGAGAFILPTLGDAAAAVVDDGETSITYGGAETPAYAFKASSPDGTKTAYCAPLNGAVDAAAAEETLAGFAHLALEVSDGATVSSPSATARLKLNADESATVEATAGDVTASLAGAGTFTLAEPASPSLEAVLSDWTNSVTYWFDFSRLECMRYISHDADTPDTSMYTKTLDWTSPTDKTMTRKTPIFERWMDWRYPEREATLWNGFYYLVTQSTAPKYCPAVATNLYPHNTALSYMHLGTSANRRLPFALTRSDSNNGSDISVAYVVMVYGSEWGGGKALVASSDEAFLRDNGKDQPFLKDTSLASDIVIRTNGVEVVDPFVATPNGDWQIVTIKMNAHKFRGLGFSCTKNYNNANYQYGEVLLVQSEPTELQLLTMEKYLADKWSLPYSAASTARIATLARAARFASLTNTVVAIGSGTVVAGTHTLKLGGSFAGTLDLQGGNLYLDGTLPLSADDVAAISPETREFWMDPDDSSTVYVGETRPGGEQSIKTLADKKRGLVAGEKHANATGQRQPYRYLQSRGLGPTRGWLDFNDIEGYLNDGNCLRFRTTPEDFKPTSSGDEGDKGAYPVFSVQTGFFVQDSLRGGGNPILDDIVGFKGTIDVRTFGSVMAPIWMGKSTFSESLNRLDGVEVDQADGFGGKPEVFTFRWTEPIANASGKSWGFANFNSSEQGKPYGEILGEILLFSNALSTDQISGIESYLMGKWLGYLPAGYADARQATVAGSGTVTLDSLANMPNIAADFAGTVSVGGATGEITMTVDAQTRKVNGAIVNSGATFTLPATATIRVKFAEAARKTIRSNYLYPLVDAAGAENTTWTVDISDASVPRNIASVVRDGDKIYLKVEKRGMALYIR